MPLRDLAKIFLFLYLLPTCAQAEDLDIQFKVSPPAQRLRPFADPATLLARVARTDGKAVEQGWIDVRLTAPKPGRFFSTDFPIVEGTGLAEMRLPLRQGKAEWKFLFPIRGDYRVSIQAVTPDGSAGKSFEIGIRENEQKWLVLGAFIAVLFLLGVIAGRVFTSVRTAAKQIAACLLALACPSLLDGRAVAQERAKDGYAARLEIEPATVGRMSEIRWSVGGRAGEAKPMARLTLTITHLEKSKIVFAVERLLVPGEFSLKFQFTDGDEYRVTAAADLAGGESVRSQQLVSVTAVEPPTKATIPALAFFVTVIAVGLGVGRWSKRAKRGESFSAAG